MKLAALALLPALALASEAAAQDPVTPFCATFDAPGDLESFRRCPPPRDNIIVQHSTSQAADPVEGFSGMMGDYYVHVTDQSRGSLGCGDGDFVGDWTELVESGCAALCFDMRVFEDGCVGGNPCLPLGYIEIPPIISIQGGPPDFLRAGFTASFTITDDVGPSPGWHRVCAPLEFVAPGGDMPSNDDGAWAGVVSGCDVMAPNSCPSATAEPNERFNDLLANVIGINLRIDFTGNPAERAGYDNICLRDDLCGPQECCDPCDLAHLLAPLLPGSPGSLQSTHPCVDAAVPDPPSDVCCETLATMLPGSPSLPSSHPCFVAPEPPPIQRLQAEARSRTRTLPRQH